MTKTAAIMGVVNAVLFALLAFGVSISDTQQLAVTGLANALLILGAVLFDPMVPFGKYDDEIHTLRNIGG